MYELDCFLVVGDEVSEEKREEIIEKGTAYLYDKWLYETGSTIPELVEDATIDLEEFCNDIGVSLTKEKKSLPPITKEGSDNKDVITNEENLEK